MGLLSKEDHHNSLNSKSVLSHLRRLAMMVIIQKKIQKALLPAHKNLQNSRFNVH